MKPKPVHIDRLLLIEDNRADARATEYCLRGADSGGYQVTVVGSLEEGIAFLQRRETDVVLLDLTLPDSTGIDTINRLYLVAGGVPIVVLTGVDDESLAMACITAGAQDYLCKTDMTPHTLRRVVGYALVRVRETQLQALRSTLERYQSLSSSRMEGSVTRALAGIPPIRIQLPDIFQELLETYRALLENYLDHLVLKKDKPRDRMEILATRLGDLGATPRDMIDVHMGALDLASRGIDQSRVLGYAADGRLFALEMMGLLVEYYRIGFRRLFPERPRP